MGLLQAWHLVLASWWPPLQVFREGTGDDGLGWTHNAWVVPGSSQALSNPFSCSQRPVETPAHLSARDREGP